MIIYFVRHGETEWNAAKRTQGRTDKPLNSAGRKQAEQARQQLSDTRIDAIFSSPLSRAVETAEIINEAFSLPITIEDALIERDHGWLEGLVIDAKERSRHWNYNDNPKDGGESPQDVFDRVHRFIDRLSQGYAGKSVLLVGHGGTARAARFYFEPLPSDGDIGPLCPPNCDISIYKLTKEDK